YINNEGHPFITSKNLKNDKIDMEKITFISDADFNKINERSKVDIGDVLFAMIGTIGNPVVIMKEPNFAIKNVALFKYINKIEPQYLKFLLKSSCVLSKMQSEANGTTQKFVSLKYLRHFTIPVPSLIEQQKIVEKLDALQEQVKQLEQIYTQKIKECDELKQSVLNKAFKGEL
ncbi:MAG: restriction endonuclease subunit S, partial [Alphaproteobacteria bacterium]|nr:restriction endonuclease subunit S [Alphaproteobacteria bacterium]